MEQHASSAIQSVADPAEIVDDSMETKDQSEEMDYLIEEEDSLPNQSMENLSFDETELPRGVRQEGDGKSMESEENGERSRRGR